MFDAQNIKPALTRSSDQFQELFWTLKRPEDIADMLEVSYRDLNYWIYRTPEPRRYSAFLVPKKSGGSRRIDIPNTNIKILQKKLNQVLRSVYRTKPSVHGFVVGKSVRSNAQQHVGKRWVFNIDLQDFFPSINFGRVRGMFMGKPYHLPEKVATVLAHLCCFQGHLPQGAPTSPVISNMICAQMDSQLQQLAQRNGSIYTRYADDITFSTNWNRVPLEISATNSVNQIIPGDKLRQTVEQNGFSINSRKVWLRGRHRRQVVTGVTVNDYPNLPRKFTNQIRAILYAWREHGLCAAQEHWAKKHSTKHRVSWRTYHQFKRALKGKIEYLGMIKGQDSHTYLKFLDQLGDLDITLTHGKGTPLRQLLRRYDQLSIENELISHQARGYCLEEIMNGLFELSGILVKASFTRNAGGEQIDGAFEFGGWYYLVECRWRSKKASKSDVDGLRGKLDLSGAQTMGLFISVNGWSQHVVNLLKQTPDKKVLLMNGDDIRAVLKKDISFGSLLQAKVEALNLQSEPFVGVADILSKESL